ncbi:sel1-like repeat [Panicum miliaceum]|uniref:Sel1-like repeat n=1 Tax=Panicum miliaceum TaxID=4540 RepID=A0A3L6TRR4_PANMI|nr:sel1-like repeat [Panicum miliaceum]
MGKAVVVAVNRGERYEAAGVDPPATLLEFLRTRTPVKGPKLGCGEAVQRSHVPHRPQIQRRPAASDSLPPAEYPAPSSETDSETTAAILPTSSCRPATGSQTIPPSSRLPCSAGITPRRLSVRPRRPVAAVAPSRHPRAIHAAPGSRGAASQSALTTILLLPLGRPAVPAASGSRHAASSSALVVLLLPLVRPAPPLPPPRSSGKLARGGRGLLHDTAGARAPGARGDAASCASDVAAASRAWWDALRPLREALALHAYGRRVKHGPMAGAAARGGGAEGVSRWRGSACLDYSGGWRCGSAAAMVNNRLMCWEEAVEDYRSPAELGHPVGICNLGSPTLKV